MSVNSYKTPENLTKFLPAPIFFQILDSASYRREH